MLLQRTKRSKLRIQKVLGKILISCYNKVTSSIFHFKLKHVPINTKKILTYLGQIFKCRRFNFIYI